MNRLKSPILLKCNTLGNRLRMARKKRGMSQEKLATKAGATQATIQKIENGRSLRPRKIEDIACALGVNPAWLMFGDQDCIVMSEDAARIAQKWSMLPASAKNSVEITIDRLLVMNAHV